MEMVFIPRNPFRSRRDEGLHANPTLNVGFVHIQPTYSVRFQHKIATHNVGFVYAEDSRG